MNKKPEKILTLHPEGKAGVNISLEKYLFIKDFIIKTIQDSKEISYQDLDHLANKVLSSGFEGSVSWYIVSVKLDLEARGIIYRKKSKGGHLLKLY